MQKYTVIPIDLLKLFALDDYYALSLNEYAIALNSFLPISTLAPLW
jgi:hypothetical protein